MSPRRIRSARTRVLRIVPELDFGGVESRIVLQSLLHDRERLDLHVATFHKLGAAAEKVRAAGIPVHVLDEHPAVRNPRATLKLRRLLATLEPQIAHASIVEANVHLLAAATIRPRLRAIVEETGMPSHSRVARAVLRVLYRRADRIIGVSQAICDYLTEVDRAPRDRVRLVYNCAGPSHFPDPPRTAPARADGPLQILAVGRLVPVKNHDTLLRALALGRERGLRAELSIAGDGPLRAELEALARSLGIAEHVRFLGFRSDVQNLLGRTDLFVLPSHSEGCSVSLVEAMAAGAMVLGSTAAGIREVLGGVADTCCVPADDPDAWARRIASIAALGSSERQRLAERLRRRAYDAFSPNVYLGHVQAQYDELLPS